jgi:hypothetical protein
MIEINLSDDALSFLQQQAEKRENSLSDVCSQIIEEYAARMQARQVSSEKRAVYFIQEGSDGPIKIGVSSDLQTRMSQLQRWSSQPLKLLFSFPGDFADERYLHQKFQHFKVKGEYFSPATDIFDYIAAHQKKDFDYSMISTEMAEYLKQQEASIQDVMKRVDSYLLEIGEVLKSAKEAVSDSTFTRYVTQHLGMTEARAYNLIARFEQSQQKTSLESTSSAE